MRPLPKAWALGFMFFGTASALTQGSVRVGSLLVGVSLLVVALALDVVCMENSTVTSVKKSRRNPTVWLVTGYGLLILQDLWISGGPSSALLASLPAGALVVAAALITSRGLAVPPRLLAVGLFLYLGAGVLTGFAGSPTVPCRSDKCSPIGALYKGGFAHENTMGFAAVLVVVMSVVYLFTARDRRLFALTVAGAALALAVMAGARSSLFAGLATAGSMLMLISIRKYRLYAVILVPVVATVAGIFLIHVAELDDFSSRGRRWIVIREAVDGVHSPFGNGLTGWADLQPAFAIPTSTHSVYGSLLVHGGLLTVVIFALFLISCAIRAARSNSFLVLALVNFAAFQGIMETIWSPTGISERAWVLIAIALTVPSDGSVEQKEILNGKGPVARIDQCHQFEDCPHGTWTSNTCTRCRSSSPMQNASRGVALVPVGHDPTGGVR